MQSSMLLNELEKRRFVRWGCRGKSEETITWIQEEIRRGGHREDDEGERARLKVDQNKA